MSEAEYMRVCEIGMQHALKGMEWTRAACLAVIEVLEGARRELRNVKRDWSQVPAALLEPDPEMVRIEQRAAKYGGGYPLRKKEVIASLAASLAPHLDGFRYYKTFEHFRRSFDGGTTYVALEYHFGTLALRFGVRVDAVEDAMVSVLGDAVMNSARLRHSPSTIHTYTYNMGPRSPHWPYPTQVTWPIRGTEGLKLATEEVLAFLTDVVIPYVTEHADIVKIRDTLINAPGRAYAHSPDSVVFAIDYLLRRKDWLDCDFKIFEERFTSYKGAAKDDLRRRYDRAVEGLEIDP